jgi:hypothetical protein
LPVASPDGRDCHPCSEIESQGCVKRLIGLAAPAANRPAVATRQITTASPRRSEPGRVILLTSLIGRFGNGEKTDGEWCERERASRRLGSCKGRQIIVGA